MHFKTREFGLKRRLRVDPEDQGRQAEAAQATVAFIGKGAIQVQ